MGLCHNIVLKTHDRGDFVDEVLYARLFEAAVPFTGAILRKLSQEFGIIKKVVYEQKRQSIIMNHV